MVNWWRYKLEESDISNALHKKIVKGINDSILFGASSFSKNEKIISTITLQDVEDVIDKTVNAYDKIPPTHTFSSFVYKDKIVNRTWKERLFTLPWKPWAKTKVIKEPAIYETPYGIVAHTCFQRELERDTSCQL
jgi:hypothetical protein